jgi:phospholipid/cholesterol/gamma-HCH transport system permease protein
VENQASNTVQRIEKPLLLEPYFTRVLFRFIGRKLLAFVDMVRGLGAFALITFGVTLTKFNVAHRVVHPLIRSQIYRAGVSLLPMVSFLAFALGFVIIGQMVSLLTRVGAQSYTGLIMVTVVVRELGPIVTALLVLARIGTATVVELGTARALGEIEALEALGIDPVHYLVMPRVLGLAVSIFCLTIYLILGALFSGYLFAFVQDIPLRPSDYFKQIALSLSWEDFILLALKTFSFGIIIAVVTCYQGLAKPLTLDDVSRVTTRAVVNSVLACVSLDAMFIVIYLML